MPVYMIRAGQHGPVKIGTAIDPFRRVQDLRAAHYEELRLLRLWLGGKQEEKTLLRAFADQRIRGEWFSFVPEMLGDVGLQEITLMEAEHAIALPFNDMPEDADKQLYRAAVRHARKDPEGRTTAEFYEMLTRGTSGGSA